MPLLVTSETAPDGERPGMGGGPSVHPGARNQERARNEQARLDMCVGAHIGPVVAATVGARKCAGDGERPRVTFFSRLA